MLETLDYSLERSRTPSVGDLVPLHRRVLITAVYSISIIDYHVVSAVTHLVDSAAEGLLIDNIDLYTPCLPVVSFRFSDEFVREYPKIEQRLIQTLLVSSSVYKIYLAFLTF